VRALFEQYKKDVEDAGHLNHITSIEVPNVVRYEPANDFFHEHIDTWNYESALRQISVIVYLNDVEEGGETVFERQKEGVCAKEGRALFFPSTFSHPHTAKPAISGRKYAMVIWLGFPNKPGVAHYAHIQ
jgi:hypothetical protein